MPRSLHRTLVASGFLLLVLGVTPGGAARTRPDYDYGFLASRGTDVNGNTRTRALGPLWESASATQGWHMAALRPFYSTYEVPAEEITGQDFLWPLSTRRQRGNESLARYGIFFSFKHDDPNQMTGKRRYRFWLLPFYFQGRDKDGLEYKAVFPLGGTIREFLGRDEIRFVLFPIRVTSKLNDLSSSSWLWPVFSKTTGDGVEMKRVFPFYGRHTREGAFEKKFILWPIWTQTRYDYRKSSGKGFILFPLFGHTKLTDQTTWWVLPPFFRYTKGEAMDLLYAPWPFIQYSRGPVDKLFIWPLWGHKKSGVLERSFYLWPIFWNEKVTHGDEVQRRFIAAPFFQNLKSSTPAQPDRPARVRSQKVWPLYSYRRVGEDSRFRVLELWPFSDTAAVERNWAPWWSILSRNRHGGNRDWELLWGLYRQNAREDGGRYWSLFPLFDRYREGDGRRGWSLLKGLLGSESVDSQRQLRLLYFFHLGSDPEAKPLIPLNQNSTTLP
jgi:hypothetical protein